MGTIANAADVPLNVRTGTIPNMGTVLLDWFQNLTYEPVVKTVTAFQVVETATPISFWGIVQPLSGRQIALKPEGQRTWNWIAIYAQQQLSLTTDDVIIFLGKQYRVMSQKSFELYSYFYYELVEDWTGSGPST